MAKSKIGKQLSNMMSDDRHEKILRSGDYLIQDGKKTYRPKKPSKDKEQRRSPVGKAAMKRAEKYDREDR